MIGRESELRLVEAFLDETGSGVRVLLLDGPAGIGKTRLWEEAIQAATGRGYRVVTTRPTEAEARLPFAGLNDLFGPMVDARLPDLPPPQQQALDIALMRASPQGEPMQPLALSLAVLELMRVATADQPLVIGIDDVPWLDESTLGIIRFALRRLGDEPVRVVVTERTSAAGGPTPPLFVDLPLDRVTHLTVSGLGEEAIDRLLDETLHLRLAPTMLRRVVRLSGGNPFFAIEIGRALARGGGAANRGLPLPESLTALLRERLESLPSEAREVVTHAAALSQPTASHLEMALGPEPARIGLEQARTADVIVLGDGPIRFAHPLLAAEVYGLMGEPERREIHRRLAGVVSEPEELARHLALGANGPDPAVAAALDTAAGHALGRGAPDAAAELSELAAHVTPPPDDGERARRMASAGRYRLMAGDAGRARELLERALEEPSASSGPARAELLYRLAGVRQLMDDFAASETLGREALKHAGDDAALTIQVKLLLAGIAFITGRDWVAGSRHAFEAMELAEQLDEPRFLAATIGPFVSWCYVTGHGYRRDLAERAAELEPWTAGFRTLDLPEYDIAVIELQEGESASAFDRLRRLLDRAERDGDYSSLPFLLANLTIGEFLEGRSDDAWALLDRAKRLAETTEQRVAQVHALAYEARLAARFGDADRALGAGAAAFGLMTATGWRGGEWPMRTELALLQLSRGEPAAALELVADARDAPGPDEPPRRRWGQSVAVEALLALGRHDDGRRVLDDFETYARSHGSPRLVGEALRARARLLAADGEVDAAEAAVTEAEAIERRIENRWELARTLLVAGQVHRRARRRARARAALREALELFAFLGAGLWARQAREELSRIDAPREQGGLTPTQRRVAELVASGMRNRQVADRLSMSVHTVEAHLSAVYQALGIRSRSEIAAALTSDASAIRDSPAQIRDSPSS